MANTSPDTVNKYAAEVRTYNIDFSQEPEIVSGDTLSAINSVTVAPSGVTIGSSAINGKTVNVVLSAGTSGTTYAVSVVVGTTAGAVLEGQFNLSVL